MNYAFHGKHSTQLLAVMVAYTNVNANTCIADTGATDHITGNLSNLSVYANYQGKDQISVANG